MKAFPRLLAPTSLLAALLLTIAAPGAFAREADPDVYVSDLQSEACGLAPNGIHNLDALRAVPYVGEDLHWDVEDPEHACRDVEVFLPGSIRLGALP